MLFCITSLRTSRNKSQGKLLEICSLLDCMKFLIAFSPVAVSMLVYIEMASAEKNKALDGIVKSFNSSIIVKEFLT